MKMLDYQDVIRACRFCFMCRHLSAVGNVTFRESDTPRGRALMADTIRMRPEALGNHDFIEAFYRADLSAACRRHCVSAYDENGLIRAVRADAVAAGCEPEAVRRLAAQLDARGHPYGAVEDALETAGLPASADVLVYVDAATLYRQPAVARALFGVLRQAGVAFTVLKETQSSGKALAMLGCLRQAAAAARATAGRIRAAGCRTVVCPSPSAFDAFANDYASLGAPLEGVSVQHSSTFLAGLFESGALKPARPGRPVAYLDSDYLKNYNALAEAPRALLRRAGCEVADFGTNREESYSLGEGAEVLDLLYPGIVKAMLGRVLDLARRDGCPALAVSSPYTLHVLRQAGEPGLRVDSVEELVAECVLIQPGNPAGARRGGRVE